MPKRISRSGSPTSAIANDDAFATTENPTPSNSPLRTSLLDFVRPVEVAALSLLRITESEVPVMPFTAEADEVHLHYVSAQEISSYVECNGDGCILCGVGNNVEHRLLNPIYCPTTGDIGILAISPSMRPHALLPQYAPILSMPERSVVFIQKLDWAKYRVTARPLKADDDDGRAVIEAFLARWQAGEVRLADVYSRLDNESLLLVPSIARMAALKGLTD